MAAFGAPPTGQEVLAFAKRFEAAVAVGDSVVVLDCLRLDNLIERCTSDLSLNASYKTGLRQGAAAGTSKLAGQFIDAVKDGGSCKFLRARTRNDKPTVVFRLLAPNEGAQHIEITLARHADGKIGAEDLFAMARGELTSLTIRRVVLQGAAGLDQQLAGKLGGKDREVVENMPQILSLQQQSQAGNSADALSTFRRLPLRLQTEKWVQILGVSAAAGVGEQEYLTEMERFRAAHPNDPSLVVLSIDFHIIRKEYDQTLQAIESLDAIVGGDPYLQSRRADVLILAKNRRRR